MAETFSWSPAYPVETTPTPQLLEATFGDGYSQSVPDGINFLRDSWALVFENRPSEEGGAIDEFLRRHGGYRWFWWLPPRASALVKVRCKTWKKTNVQVNTVTVTATFTQVFDLGD